MARKRDKSALDELCDMILRATKARGEETPKRLAVSREMLMNVLAETPMFGLDLCPETGEQLFYGVRCYVRTGRYSRHLGKRIKEICQEIAEDTGMDVSFYKKPADVMEVVFYNNKRRERSIVLFDLSSSRLLSPEEIRGAVYQSKVMKYDEPSPL